MRFDQIHKSQQELHQLDKKVMGFRYRVDETSQSIKSMGKLFTTEINKLRFDQPKMALSDYTRQLEKTQNYFDKLIDSQKKMERGSDSMAKSLGRTLRGLDNDFLKIAGRGLAKGEFSDLGGSLLDSLQTNLQKMTQNSLNQLFRGGSAMISPGSALRPGNQSATGGLSLDSLLGGGKSILGSLGIEIPGVGSLFSGSTGALLGAAGSGAGLGGMVAGLTGGNALAGNIGGGLATGIASIAGLGGPIGLGIGAVVGGLAGSLFKKKPSNYAAGTTFDPITGEIFEQGNKGGQNVEARDKMVEAVMQGTQQLTSITGLEFDRQVNVTIGSRDGYDYVVGNTKRRLPIGDAEGYISSVMKEITLQLTDLPATMREEIEKIDFSNLEQAFTELDMLFNLGHKVNMSIMQVASPAFSMLGTWAEEYQKMIDNAESVGGSLVKIDHLYGIKRHQILKDFSQNELDILKDFYNENTRIAKALEDEKQLRIKQENKLISQLAVEGFTQLKENISEFADDLYLDPKLSILSPLEQLNHSRAAFDNLAKRAEEGDYIAAMEIPDLAQNFLNFSRGYHATGEGYIDDFNRVQSVITGTQNQSDKQIANHSEQIELLHEQISIETGMLDTLHAQLEQLDALTKQEKEKRAQEEAKSGEQDQLLVQEIRQLRHEYNSFGFNIANQISDLNNQGARTNSLLGRLVAQ